jgi:hypothetical protein
MRTITKEQLSLACAATVESWDLETLIEYAIDSMIESAKLSEYAVVGNSEEAGGLYFETSASTEQDAANATEQFSDSFNGGLFFVRIDLDA